MADDQSPAMVLATRRHRILDSRSDKLRLNLLALQGGRPYVKERLTRFPGESAIDWSGSIAYPNKTRFQSPANSIPAEGRKQRAYLVNHAARVAEKIRQYVFAKPPERANVNPEMAQDITRHGDSLNQFMGDVLRYLVAGRWCWIGIDAPRIDGPLSIKQAQDEKVRPYWVLYSPADVVDWHMDDKGDLTWLLTETEKWDNPDPFSAQDAVCVRRLWRPGSVQEFLIEKNSSGEVVDSTPRDQIPIGFDAVPFVPCGNISDAPHWFDDVEDLQRAILDMESSLDTLFFKCVFGQMILPRTMADDIVGETTGGQNMSQQVSAIIGHALAVLEGPDDKGITRYIAPDGSSINAIQTELERKKQELFDTVGLHLGFTKNFSESAQAKEFDHLDPQAVLRNYSQQIAEAESKAWKLTNRWDSDVPVIMPEYTDKFRVSNIYEDFKSLVLGAQMDLPDSMQRVIQRAVLDTVLEITNQRLPQEQYDKILADIKAHDFTEPIELTATDIKRVGDGVKKQATDDGEGVRASGAE